LYANFLKESRERYRSCLIVWTKANNAPRFFDPAEDVTYLSAFAHSLRAELARLETTASDAAKGAFISGISHELRSPLHGVLAGVELLQDSKLTPFQHEMALSVALAGRTLLDTVDHILDYSKISNLSRGQKRDRAKVDTLRHHSAEGIHGNGLASVDLARLTEEVVESAISAHRHLRRPTSETSSSQHAVSVTLDIEKRDSWTTAMMPGTWVRILNNILGNALKYTPEGVVSVKLFTSSDENQVTHVNLQIQDTGIGMTQEFVRTEMWHPFKQADTHSPGTGLGLSIVKEVAKDLDATISAKSELGKGTSVTIRFLANFHHLTTPTPDPQERRLESFAGKPPRHFHMVKSQEDITDANGELGTRAVAESVARTAENWLGFKAFFSDGPTSHPAHTVCAVFERDLLLLYDKDPQLADTLLSRLATEGTQILIIAQSVASSQPDFDFERFELRPLYVYQP
jgi:signal transduction histidine kinase